jgi:DNA-binding response OmpR family regulator
MDRPKERTTAVLTKCHILVIEEDQETNLVLAQAFEKAGLMAPLHLVPDAEEAKSYLQGDGKYGDREKYPLPMLILLNPRPPEGSSFGFLRWLRSQALFGGTPVVILTMGITPEALAQAYFSGANSVLVPTTLEELRESVSAIRRYWLLTNLGPNGKSEKNWP